MTEKLQQTIIEEAGKLPKEIQAAINTSDWVKIAESIGKTYQLNEDEIEDFQLETLLVLIGAVDPKFYAINIENQVEITKEDAISMADEVLNKILIPINNTIKENIKVNIKSTNPDWKQSIDFVLSGGNYATFLENKDASTFETPADNTKNKVNVKII